MIWSIAVAGLAVGGFFLFRNTMNRLQYIGFLYWITRDIGSPSDPFISTGFMRQTSPPWKVGKGIQFRVSKYVFQVGFCKSLQQGVSDDEGLLRALEGRMLDADPKTIRNWK